jgi:hypothetical protein
LPVLQARRMEIQREAVVDCPQPVRPLNRGALCIRDRDEGNLGVCLKKGAEVGLIQEAVQRGDARAWIPAKEWKLHVVGMEVDDIELRHVTEDPFHKANMVRQRFPARGVVPEGRPASRDEPRGRNRIAARKECYVVSEFH